MHYRMNRVYTSKPYNEKIKTNRRTKTIQPHTITKDENIGFDGYIATWILRIYPIYRRYIGGYFYMNINILEIKLL